MNGLVIKQLTNKDQVPWNLLLLADPSKKNVQEYLTKGNVYLALLKNKVIGEYVLVRTSGDIVELKNIAVDEKYHRRGIGKLLVMDVVGRARNYKANRVEVGTGNSSLAQLTFYKQCGFKVVGIDKGFFTRNYKQKIMENGIQCVDMIQLAIDL